MTTIAYRDGVMAADTMGSWSGDVQYFMPKLAKTDRFLMGFAGDYDFAHPMFEWVVSKGELPIQHFYRDPPEFNADKGQITVLLAPTGGENLLWYFSEDGHGAPIWNKNFESIGSGSRFALGAMYFGATAREAVGAAINLDDSTGGGIVSISNASEPCDIFSLDMSSIIM